MPSPNQLPNPNRYRVTLPGVGEGIKYTLYDFQTYAAAGQTSLTFFQVPIGQSGKTLDDTNMKMAGQLSAGNVFIIEGIEILFYPGVLPGINAAGAGATEFTNDVYTFSKSGHIYLQVLDKKYVEEAPLARIPPRSRLDVTAAAATTVAASQLTMDYSSCTGVPYLVEPFITLQENMAFNVTMEWAAAVALPSSQPARIGVALNGKMFRKSQ